MFWRHYASVVGWLLGVGIVLGALVFFVVLGWLSAPDPDEEFAVVFMPFFGAFAGITASAACLTYRIGLGLWIRRPGRSVASRAWTGALAAGAGALAVLVVPGFATGGFSALPLWLMLGGACAAVALLVAGPLTARAARRADGRATARTGVRASKHLT